MKKTRSMSLERLKANAQKICMSLQKLRTHALHEPAKAERECDSKCMYEPAEA